MSLWLQSAIDALEEGDYKGFREILMPICPIPIPKCMIKELEFAERSCFDTEKEWLFPIRFLWLLEANEQRMFELNALERSVYHPEKLYNMWQKVLSDFKYRQELEIEGYKFNFIEKAIKFPEGWIYFGDQFIEDFIEVESTLGVELMFPSSLKESRVPAFQEFKNNINNYSNQYGDQIS